MKNETKNEVKKNVATGVSTAAGATAGVVIGATISPNCVEAAEGVTPEPNPTAASTHSPAPHAAPTPAPDPEPTPTPQPQPEPVAVTPVSPTLEAQPEVEVLGYDRITNNDGSQMDIAVLNVNGNEIGVIDANLNGQADALVCDINQNGIIEEGEMEIVEGMGIAMQPFQDAAGFNPQFAQNDLPDYVNDADVDTYMV